MLLAHPVGPAQVQTAGEHSGHCTHSQNEKQPRTEQTVEMAFPCFARIQRTGPQNRTPQRPHFNQEAAQQTKPHAVQMPSRTCGQDGQHLGPPGPAPGRVGGSPGRCPTGGWCSAGAAPSSAGCSSSGRRTADIAPHAAPGADGLVLQETHRPQGCEQHPRRPGSCPSSGSQGPCHARHQGTASNTPKGSKKGFLLKTLQLTLPRKMGGSGNGSDTWLPPVGCAWRPAPTPRKNTGCACPTDEGLVLRGPQQNSR